MARDCLELLLDLRTPDQKAAAKGSFYNNTSQNVCQYILAPATADMPKPEAMVGAGDKAMLKGLLCASSLTNTGYVLECMVPAERFPAGVMKPGSTYGFDFTVNDVDRFDSWNDLLQLRWSGSQYSFFSVLEFGRVTLAGQ